MCVMLFKMWKLLFELGDQWKCENVKIESSLRQLEKEEIQSIDEGGHANVVW